MKSFSRFLLSSTVLLTLALASNIAVANESKWQGHIEAEGKWGTDRSLGELGLFLPAWQDDDTLVFGNLIGRFDEYGSSEAISALACASR